MATATYFWLVNDEISNQSIEIDSTAANSTTINILRMIYFQTVFVLINVSNSPRPPFLVLTVETLSYQEQMVIAGSFPLKSWGQSGQPKHFECYQL